MKITFITTVNHNVGDDFVREGLKWLLQSHYKNQKIKFINVHKHSPITVRYGFEKVRRQGLRIDKTLPLWLPYDKILSADILIQSGAPVYWCHPETHCADNEWYKPLIKKRYLKVKDRVPLLNLAAGTCQRYFSDATEFLACKKDIQYIKEFYGLCKVTTVRDTLAKKLLNMLELDAPVIPCSSIFSTDEYGLKAQDGDYVVMNYMSGGGHYTFGQTIGFEKWKSELKRFYNEIKKYDRVVFSCHNKKEVEEVKKFDPDAEVFYSNRFFDFMKFYSRAKFGIMNRVHGAFLMASYGRPSLIIGTDTRARMASEIGLKSFFVNDVDFESLMSEYLSLLENIDRYNDSFQEIKKRAFYDYMKALSVI